MDVPSILSHPAKDGNASTDKDRRSGLMSNFRRPRVASSDLGLTDCKGVDSSSTMAPEDCKNVGAHGDHGSTDKSSAPLVISQTRAGQQKETTSTLTIAHSRNLSTTNSEISFQSGYRLEGDDDIKNEGEKKSRFFRGLSGHGRGSSGSGKSLLNSTVFKQRRDSWQMQSRTEIQPQSITDTMGPEREVHPHHNSNTFEKMELYHTGSQEAHGSSVDDADPLEQTLQQLCDAPMKRDASSPTTPTFNIRQEMLQGAPNTSASNSSINSNTSNVTQAASIKSSKLGRLFKFPSISVGKNKTQVNLQIPATFQEPVPSNLRRGSLPALYFRPPMLEQPVKGPGIHGTTLTSTPTSDLHSGVKISRHTLSSSVDVSHHTRHHRHSSTTLTGMTSATGLNSGTFAHQRPVLGGKDTTHSNLSQHHRSGLKNFFGSERFTSSTSGGRSHEHSQYQDGYQVPVHGDNTEGAIREEVQGINPGHGPRGISALKASVSKRTSRRTVSASHIASNDIFTADLTRLSEDSHHLDQQGFQSASDSDIQAASFLQTEDASPQKTTVVGDGSVGQYLFGSELKDMSFGETNAALAEAIMDDSDETIVNTPWLNKSTLLAQRRATGTTTSHSRHPSSSQSAAGTHPLRPKNKSDPSLLSSVASFSQFGPSSTTTQSPGVDCKTAVSPDLARSLQASSSSSIPLKPLSPVAIANARMDIKRQGSPGHYSSPPSPHTISPSSIFTNPKASISGPSSDNPAPASIAPGRPPVGYPISSLLIASAVGTTKPLPKPTTYPGPRPNTTSTPARNPNIPHLEPRSAVAEYTPIIHYKRQRSMSLQDADLQTMEQFIADASMPDDVPPKRRFSSEEGVSAASLCVET